MSRFFLNKTYYFITCPNFEHQKIFSGNKKDIILKNIIQARNKFKIRDLNFGINSNHYHLLGYFADGAIIPKFLKEINGPSAMNVNKFDRIKGRKIWGEYHVYFVNNQDVLEKIKAYVVGNPYKHDEVKSLEELANYKYSSFKNFNNKKDFENQILSVIKMSDKDFYKELDKINANKLAEKREQVRLEKKIIRNES